jgi:hypothetical protein
MQTHKDSIVLETLNKNKNPKNPKTANRRG